MILIALGANLPSPAGPPVETVKAAFGVLGRRGIQVEASSFLYRSPAWPDPSDPPFVNAVAKVGTRLSPAELLRTLHEIEDFFGRIRSWRNAPRTLDLDLIDYDGRCEPGPPELPHPRLAERRFVLQPLADVAPHWRHPVGGRSVSELIALLPLGSLERLPG
jgi:2-amino-4-hydroxy-6-hydroxymethyldihydropteridine diphosphokinase